MPAFAELAVTTNFSFLTGGSHPEELAFTAAKLGLAGIAVADKNTLAGGVRAALPPPPASPPASGAPAPGGGDRPAPGGTPQILAWPRDRAAYGRLCRLLT